MSPGSGTARMHLTDFAVPDFGDFFNSVLGGQSVPGRATFDIRWLGDGERTTVSDADNQFEERLVQGHAVIEWTASNANGYRYTTGPTDTQVTLYAAVGHERNGTFFHG